MMARNPLFLLVKLALSVCLIAVAGVAPARERTYLVALGPAPLRFQSRPTAKPAVLPPLVAPAELHKTQPGVATNPPTLPNGGQTNQSANPPSVNGSGTDLAPGTNSAAALLLPPLETHDQGEPAMVDPQSVLGYLAPVPNKTPDGRMPLPGFVPPAPPAAPRSSRAIYESH